MKSELSKSVISYRIGTERWMEESRFAELLASFDSLANGADEMTFFTGETHAPLPLKTIEERAAILAGRMPIMRERGYRTGINHLSTLGHHAENMANSLAGDYVRMRGIDGCVSPGVLCPNDERVREHTRQSYRALALANPDYIWIDDDVRMGNHAPVGTGCFCDNCIAIFSKSAGINYTRQSLRDAFNNGPIEKKLEVRRAWIEHNRNTMARFLELIEEAVHGTNPDIILGIMTCDHYYEGYDYPRWTEILSGPNNLQVMWRPGGGFYFDDCPGGFITKAHSIGRQISGVPRRDLFIQSEIENFPYQPLKKSKHINALETAVYIAAGCTGAAFNVLPMSDEPLSIFSPLLNKLTETRPFYDLMVSNIGRERPRGVYTGWCRDSFIAGNPGEGGDWLTADTSVYASAHAHEILNLGIPAAYSLDDAQVTLLSGNSVLAMSEKDILRILSSGVYMDAPALAYLNEMGYADLTGFAADRVINDDCIERLNGHPLNCGFEGQRRDARQSFGSWAVPATVLNATNAGAEVLAGLVDYTPKEIAPCCMGVFENRLGGRVCVAGYYPWTFLESFAKSTQIKALMRWLSKDDLHASVASFHRAALWIREPEAGKLVIALVNPSVDVAEDLTLMLKTQSGEMRVYDMKCVETSVASSGSDGSYQKFVLPIINPWDMRLIVVG